jgi:hypothetical protein
MDLPQNRYASQQIGEDGQGKQRRIVAKKKCLKALKRGSLIMS